LSDSSLATHSEGKALIGDEVAKARCPEPEEPADDAEVPTRSKQQSSRGQAEESKPGGMARRVSNKRSGRS